MTTHLRDLPKKLVNITGYSSYSIDENGNLYSSYGNRFLKWSLNDKGYLFAKLKSDNGVLKQIYKHQAMAIAFLNHSICGHDRVIDHIDGNPLNNSLANLRVVSSVENSNFGRSRKHDLPNRISKQNCKTCKQGYIYVYRNGSTRKTSTNLNKLINEINRETQEAD